MVAYLGKLGEKLFEFGGFVSLNASIGFYGFCRGFMLYHKLYTKGVKLNEF